MTREERNRNNRRLREREEQRGTEKWANTQTPPGIALTELNRDSPVEFKWNPGNEHSPLWFQRFYSLVVVNILNVIIFYSLLTIITLYSLFFTFTLSLCLLCNHVTSAPVNVVYSINIRLVTSSALLTRARINICIRSERVRSEYTQW